MSIRVFLVDDHEIVRRGIAELLSVEGDIEVVGESGTARQTMPRVAATSPQVVVLDVNLPDGNGIDLCRAIRSADPGIACVILTAFDDHRASDAALLAGAAAYVLKDVRGNNLVATIRRAARGDRLRATFSSEIASTSNEGSAGAGTPELSLRQRQVLALIADGMTNREIGERLGLTEKTVKNYVSGLLSKLGMVRRTQAAVFGAAHRDT